MGLRANSSPQPESIRHDDRWRHGRLLILLHHDTGDFARLSGSPNQRSTRWRISADDLGLPDLPGGEVLLRLKADQRTRHVPVIVLSGDINPQLSTHLLELGAIQCLRKPFGFSEFLLAIEGAADTV